jgi:hypothetical protein
MGRDGDTLDENSILACFALKLFSGSLLEKVTYWSLSR